MKTVLMAILVILGIFILPTLYFPLGCAMIWCGWWIHERMTPRDEDNFMAGLFILGGLGVVATVLFATTGWVRAQL